MLTALESNKSNTALKIRHRKQLAVDFLAMNMVLNMAPSSIPWDHAAEYRIVHIVDLTVIVESHNRGICFDIETNKNISLRIG